MNWSNYDPHTALDGAKQCPHCGGTAHISPDDELRYKCGVCGAPRIEVDGVEMTDDVIRPLKAAREEQKGRAGWRTAGIASGAFGAMSAFVAFAMLLIFGLGVASGVSLFFTALWTALAVIAFGKGKAKTKAMMSYLDDAWRLAARDVLAAHPDGLTAAELGKRLDLTEHQANQVAAELSLDGAVRSRITDDGRQVLSAPSNLRIQPQMGGDPLAERFEALEEQMATEEAATAQQQQHQMKR